MEQLKHCADTIVYMVSCLTPKDCMRGADLTACLRLRVTSTAEAPHRDALLIICFPSFSIASSV